MEDFSVIYAGQLTDQGNILFSNANGCIIKNLIFYNTEAQPVEVSFDFDDVPFVFELQANEFKRLDMVMFTKKINASGKGVNVHISGLKIS